MSTQKLILAGTKLSNIVYNLEQNDKLPEHVRQSMIECYKEWDEAVKQLHKPSTATIPVNAVQELACRAFNNFYFNSNLSYSEHVALLIEEYKEGK